MTYKVYRLPDGSMTGRLKLYVDSWTNKAKIIERITGMELSGFNPDLLFVSNSRASLTLPVWFIDKLESYIQNIKKRE